MPGEREFGLVIAFLLPGFLLLWGLSLSVPSIAAGLDLSSQSEAPTVGGFLYVTLASLALGLVISALRWATVDQIHDWTGVKRPQFNDAALKDQHTLNAFQNIIENHYRYYQYYSNTLVLVVISFAVYNLYSASEAPIFVWILITIIVIILFIGSRDALKKYYSRGQRVLDGGESRGEASGGKAK